MILTLVKYYSNTLEASIIFSYKFLNQRHAGSKVIRRAEQRLPETGSVILASAQTEVVPVLC